MDPFLLKITHKGAEQEFEVQPVLVGYTAQFQVYIGEVKIVFEPDEENNLRAMVPDTYKNPDVALLQKLAAGIENWL